MVVFIGGFFIIIIVIRIIEITFYYFLSWCINGVFCVGGLFVFLFLICKIEILIKFEIYFVLLKWELF